MKPRHNGFEGTKRICLFLLKLVIANLHSKRKKFKNTKKQYYYYFSLLPGSLLRGSTMKNIDRAYKSENLDNNVCDH